MVGSGGRSVTSGWASGLLTQGQGVGEVGTDGGKRKKRDKKEETAGLGGAALVGKHR